MILCTNCGLELDPMDFASCCYFDRHETIPAPLCRACYCWDGGSCYHCELDEVGGPPLAPLPRPEIREPEPADRESWGKAEYRPDEAEDE